MGRYSNTFLDEACVWLSEALDAWAARATPPVHVPEGEMIAALKEAEETLRLSEHPAFRDPKHGDEVEALGRRIGFGALMSSASASWRSVLKERGDPVGGEFVAGPCHATVIRTLGIIRAALARSPLAEEGWRSDMGNAPQNSSEFQAWVAGDNGQEWWEPRCRIEEDSGAFQIFGRTDYDQDGWDVYPHITPTHWMPIPRSPSPTGGR